MRPAPPLQLEPLTTIAALMLGLAGVAALARGMVGLVLSNPIPYEQKQQLYERYGRWAVEAAEAACPQGDGACVEREARRLSQVRLTRR